MRKIELTTRLREERGVSAVIVSICLVALFGAAMLTVDAGSLWTTRRTVITATDAAALNAARMFATGQANPCDPASVATVEANSTQILLSNNPSALHDATETPGGFEVTLSAPCGSSAFIAGKVRYDAKLTSTRTVSGLFGFEATKAFASSTAAWGYVSGIGNGLRPIAVCDQSQGAPAYPHYQLWVSLKTNAIDQATYDSYYGTVPTEYPSVSANYGTGTSAQNPNKNKTYGTPANGFHTVHRIKMPDPNCGVSPGDRTWVDFKSASGAVGANELRDQLLYGYKGSVSLTPHDCNPGDSTPPSQNCGSATGDKATLERALKTLTCDVATLALQCPYQFPVLAMRSISMPGSNAEYDQTAFLYVVLRGFSDLTSTAFEMDFEFIDAMTSGEISAAPPTSGTVPLVGIQLCGADHVGDRCGF